ncbi:hypothetical protein BGW37DRAFT_479260 [Umbelopsis sp. PMI_123]|nr:hypothetical protein BGW37DRAFT_479260 [Umbelopsis sp. PMI_123]
MRITAVLSLVATSLLVSAQTTGGPTETEPIFITSPVGSTTELHTGKNFVIEWFTNPKAPESVDIELLQNFVVRETIASRIKSDSHRFNWAIPDSLDSSKNYAIRIGDTTYTSYSHPFSIKGEGEFPANEPSAPTGGVQATAVMKTTAGTASNSVHEMASSSSMSHATGSASSSSPATATVTHSSGASSKMTGATLIGAVAGAAVVAFAL